MGNVDVVDEDATVGQGEHAEEGENWRAFAAREM